MPVWLTPRIRLGATAVLIVLIAGALLVTPQLFHDDNANAPGSLTSVNASIDLHTVPPPPSRKPPIVLPHVVLSEPDSTLPSQSLRQGARNGDAAASTSSTQADQSTQASDAEPDPESQATQAAQDSTNDSAGPSYSLASDGSSSGGSAPSAANGSLVSPSGGGGAGGPRGGTPKQQQPIPLGYDNGGSPGPVLVPPVTPPPVIQPVVLPPNGSVNGDFSGPPPTDPPGPPPIDPPVVQVPEPTSFVMAGMGALGFMIRRLARKRRG